MHRFDDSSVTRSGELVENDLEEALDLLRQVDDYGIRRSMDASWCNRLDVLLMKHEEDDEEEDDEEEDDDANSNHGTHGTHGTGLGHC